MGDNMTMAKEKDFQTIANEHAHGSVEWMREHLDEEDQRERISSEDALSVEVRSDWHNPGMASEDRATEYRILLGTGGPATRIIGDLDEYGQPTNATFQFQDWCKPWTAANDLSEEQEKTLLEYAQQFYFGE
jgi:hypothetical protein